MKYRTNLNMKWPNKICMECEMFSSKKTSKKEKKYENTDFLEDKKIMYKKKIIFKWFL